MWWNSPHPKEVVMSETIDCPWCGHEHTPTYSHADDEGFWECHSCEMEFKVHIDYDPYFSTEKVFPDE